MHDLLIKFWEMKGQSWSSNDFSNEIRHYNRLLKPSRGLEMNRWKIFSNLIIRELEKEARKILRRWKGKVDLRMIPRMISKRIESFTFFPLQIRFVKNVVRTLAGRFGWIVLNVTPCTHPLSLSVSPSGRVDDNLSRKHGERERFNELIWWTFEAS